jgi:hypothetical protein
MAERTGSTYSLRFNLQVGLAAGLLFWIQFAYPHRAVGCWSVLGAMLFLALSYPSRFWASITGIFGFEAGLLLGMLLGVQSHWLWILTGLAGSVLLTLIEHGRLTLSPAARREPQELKIEVLAREVGLGAFAGSVAASLLRSEVLRLYLLAALILGLRLLLDLKRRQKGTGA